MQRVTYSETERHVYSESDMAAATELVNSICGEIPAAPPLSAEEIEALEAFERERPATQESLRTMPLKRVYWHVVRGMIYILDEDPEILVEDFVGVGGLEGRKLTDDEWQAAMNTPEFWA